MDYDPRKRGSITQGKPARRPAASVARTFIAGPADTDKTRINSKRILAALLQIISGHHALALADQAVVSGASFVTLILVSRWTNPNQLGLYSIGISILVSSLAVQYALVSLPYTIQHHHPIGTPAEYAGSSLAQSGLLSALSIVLLAVTALGLSTQGARPDLVAMTWALAATVPFALLREFGRFYAFAHLRMGTALMLDSAVAAMQLAAICWLGTTGRMSPATACSTIGGACALTGVVWLYLSRANFAIGLGQLPAATKQAWRLGKWLFAHQITESLQCYVTYWLLAFILGATATGVYAACMSIALFANPLMMGISHTLAPKSILALKAGGYARLRREAARASLLLAIAMSLFCLVLLFAGEHAMRLLYPGTEYAGNGHVVVVLGLGMLASAIRIPANFGLTSMERPQAIVWAGTVGVFLTVVLACALMTNWGLFGAACGFLAGTVAGGVGVWIAFLTCVPRSPSKPDPNADPMMGHAEDTPIGAGLT